MKIYENSLTYAIILVICQVNTPIARINPAAANRSAVPGSRATLDLGAIRH